MRRYAPAVTPAAPPTSSGIAGQLAELADVLVLRHRLVVLVSGGACLLGLLLLLPGVLPARATVGAAVGLAAGLLGVAAAVAVDSADTVVQGARHVRSLDGEVLAEAPAGGSEATLGPLARRILRHGGTAPLRLAVTAVSEETFAVRAWTERLARAFARQPRRVMLFDPIGTEESGPGIAEVAAGEVRMADAVTFDEELLLATLRGGGDGDADLLGVPDLFGRLPGDVEVALAPLPSVIRPGTLEVAAGADQVLVVVERGHSRRVDLLAVLDALESTGSRPRVVLLGDRSTVIPWGSLGAYFDASTTEDAAEATERTRHETTGQPSDDDRMRPAVRVRRHPPAGVGAAPGSGPSVPRGSVADGSMPDVLSPWQPQGSGEPGSAAETHGERHQQG